MNTRTSFPALAILALLLGLSGPVWAVCNPDNNETGASSVVDLQGQGNFSCSQIAGDVDNCLNGACTMVPAPGFTYQIQNNGPRRFVTWSAPQQVDKIFVTASGNGSRCLYDFEPGSTSGSFLEPAANASQTSVVACYDGVEADVPPPPPEKPISTTTNCATALPGLQMALDTDPGTNIITLIGIGTDQGLNNQGTTDGDYVLAVCSAGSQVQCVDQCLPPTDKVYAACGAVADEACLAERACATSDELPTGNPDAEQYCWELSHGVDIEAGKFTPPIEKETGSATWEQYEGSTCVKVTTTYRGTTYSYYSPSGCKR